MDTPMKTRKRILTEAEEDAVLAAEETRKKVSFKSLCAHYNASKRTLQRALERAKQRREARQ